MLYPIKKSFAIHKMKRDQHLIYVEEYGNKNGIPIIFLHGGPGSGCNDWQKGLFNSKVFRVVFVDQRGSGKSVPKRSLENNSTYELIDDIEYLRKFLKIDDWFLVGGSWGSTLAIAYGQKHPDVVKGMVLRSLFLGTTEEIEWAFRKGPLIFKPKLIYELNLILKNSKDENPTIKLGKMLESKNISDKCIAAELWQEYEKNLSSINSLEHDFESIVKNKIYNLDRLEKTPNTPFLENHFIKNNFFLEKNQLNENKAILHKIPISIIQGEYDLLCPPSTSFLFVDGLNKAKIIKAKGAGHYISDPGIKELMKKEIDELQYL